ncbi:MAG TPA: DUF4336 domain-containing protein [Candidatus Acidoferrales bacterium]|nr:DUF4336 domain-containing protein [Candidatus Acidoferrales bacterium]
MLTRLTPDLWTVNRRQRLAGIQVGTRMTVIRLPEQRLWLHSPVALTPELRADLDALGTPCFAVAPNRYHHLYAGEYTTAYPDLQLFVAPGLDIKRPDLRIAGVLHDTGPDGWRDCIDQVVVRGYPMFNEVVFFHGASHTLLTSDLVFNIQGDSPALTRWIFRAIAGYGRFGPTLFERVMIRDRATARVSFQRILSWNFDRVILAHGHVLERGGRDALRRGYAWLL